MFHEPSNEHQAQHTFFPILINTPFSTLYYETDTVYRTTSVNPIGAGAKRSWMQPSTTRQIIGRLKLSAASILSPSHIATLPIETLSLGHSAISPFRYSLVQDRILRFIYIYICFSTTSRSTSDILHWQGSVDRWTICWHDCHMANITPTLGCRGLRQTRVTCAQIQSPCTWTIFCSGIAQSVCHASPRSLGDLIYP